MEEYDLNRLTEQNTTHIVNRYDNYFPSSVWIFATIYFNPCDYWDSAVNMATPCIILLFTQQISQSCCFQFFHAVYVNFDFNDDTTVERPQYTKEQIKCVIGTSYTTPSPLLPSQTQKYGWNGLDLD